MYTNIYGVYTNIYGMYTNIYGVYTNMSWVSASAPTGLRLPAAAQTRQSYCGT